MITTSINYASLVIRAIILAVLLLLLYTIIQTAGMPGNSTGSILAALLLVGFPTLLLLTSLCGVMRVDAESYTDTITVSGIFFKTSFTANQVTGFYESIERSKRKNFNGLIIVLDNGKSYEVIEYNVKSIDEIEQYLKDKSIHCMGKRRSWFPLKRPIK